MIVPFVLATNHPKTFKELVIFILTNSSWFLPKINLFIVFSLFWYLFLECFIKDWIRVIRIKESNLPVKTYSLVKLKSWGIFLFQPFYWCFLFPLFVLMQYGYIFFDRLIFSILGFTIFLIFQHVRHTILSYKRCMSLSNNS